MKTRIVLLTLILLLIGFSKLNAQLFTWVDSTTAFNLPDGISIYYGSAAGRFGAKAWQVKIDLKKQNLALVPYLSNASSGVQSLSSFSENVGAHLAINGGFFNTSNGTSFSTVVQPGEVLSRNVMALTRNGKSYPVIRSMFSVKENKSMSVDWVYHFNEDINGLYKFSNPMAYVINDTEPKAAPSSLDGALFEDAYLGIGGGPTLVKGDSVNLSWSEEIFWGAGVERDIAQLRTGIGYTANQEVIMIISTGSFGFTLVELANEFKLLGCVEAMNLDGGGSSQLVVNHKPLNSNSRLIPSIIAIVPIDSIPGYQPVAEFEQIIDTGDADKVTKVGASWFETGNAGFYGETKSLLHSNGDGEAYFSFKPTLPAESEYEVFSWWVASSNRATNTPHIIFHKNGIDTIRVNQTTNNAKWVSIGTFKFSGTNADSVAISNKVSSSGTVYVVADAIKFVKVKTTSNEEFRQVSQPKGIQLLGNYPNPFNPSTKIRYELADSGPIKLSIYSVLGQEISSFNLGNKSIGRHEFTIDGSNFMSGIYMYQIEQITSSSRYSANGKMTLIK